MTWTAADTKAAAGLATRLPECLYDMHAHLFRTADLGSAMPELCQVPGGAAGVDVWRRQVGQQVGGGSRLGGALFIPFPTPTVDTAAANRFVLEQAAACPDSRALLLARPDQTTADLLPFLADARAVGLKPYHTLSRSTPTWQLPISGYAPEWMWRLADERGLVLTLHVVRDAAMADPENQRELRDFCTRYPRARVILAHAARGFHYPNTVRAVRALRQLQNLWFDTSGICQPEAIEAILGEFGPRRVLWGSDFPVSDKRGTCVTVGDGFAWINPVRTDEASTAPALDTWPVGLENLRAVLAAADATCCSADDLRDLFHDNARRLLGLDAAAPDKTQALYRHACEVIPGGVQLLSKRPEMFAPTQWPAYFREARGCEIWDLDGRHYYDFSINGIGTCVLGYADPDVTRAVMRRVRLGAMSSLNPPEEVELAERLCQLHPWAEQARFGRTGGEVAAEAVRIARATTDRSLVAICGYHGWQDWYLAANLGSSDNLRGHLLPGLDPLGVPRELRGTTLPFTYNNRAEFSRIIAEHGAQLAAVVMEPCRGADPEPGFLEFVRDEAHKAGAFLIFDEITIGWRLAYGGAHLRLGVNPDMAIFAKAMGNGHPMSAVIGTRAAMEGAHTSFISSSYWTESVGPVAALATIRKMGELRTWEYITRVGRLIQEVWRQAAAAHGLPLKVSGYPPATNFVFEHPQAMELKTLFVQCMLAKGFLASNLVYVTMAHNEENVALYAEAVDAVFREIAAAIAAGDVEKRLKGPVCHSGFRRLI